MVQNKRQEPSYVNTTFVFFKNTKVHQNLIARQVFHPDQEGSSVSSNMEGFAIKVHNQSDLVWQRMQGRDIFYNLASPFFQNYASIKIILQGRLSRNISFSSNLGGFTFKPKINESDHHGSLPCMSSNMKYQGLEAAEPLKQKKWIPISSTSRFQP